MMQQEVLLSVFDIIPRLKQLFILSANLNTKFSTIASLPPICYTTSRTSQELGDVNPSSEHWRLERERMQLFAFVCGWSLLSFPSQGLELECHCHVMNTMELHYVSGQAEKYFYYRGICKVWLYAAQIPEARISALWRECKISNYKHR